MNNFKKLILIALVLILTPIQEVMAGNPDRTGQSGMSELLINPWSRSVGFNGINISSVQGLDGMSINIGGLTFIESSQVSFARTEYLGGSGIGMNTLGFAQKIGDGAIGISVMNSSYGEIEVTTVDRPEGGLGFFAPQFLNIGLGYSHSFADFIHGGVVLRVISMSIADVSAQGVAIDAGLIYTTGSDAHPDRFKFGVTLKNVGTPMGFRGDGLQDKADISGGDFTSAIERMSQVFELPAQLSIGASYDFYFTGENRLTALGSFNSNAFYKDHYGAGLEYGLNVRGREMFMLRAGYRYEEGLLSETERTNIHTGLAAGFTFEFPFTQNVDSPTIALDYGYRTSNPLQGSHTVGFSLEF